MGDLCWDEGSIVSGSKAGGMCWGGGKKIMQVEAGGCLDFSLSRGLLGWGQKGIKSFLKSSRVTKPIIIGFSFI